MASSPKGNVFGNQIYFSSRQTCFISLKWNGGGEMLEPAVIRYFTDKRWTEISSAGKKNSKTTQKKTRAENLTKVSAVLSSFILSKWLFPMDPELILGTLDVRWVYLQIVLHASDVHVCDELVVKLPRRSCLSKRYCTAKWRTVAQVSAKLSCMSLVSFALPLCETYRQVYLKVSLDFQILPWSWWNRPRMWCQGNTGHNAHIYVHLRTIWRQESTPWKVFGRKTVTKEETRGDVRRTWEAQHQQRSGSNQRSWSCEATTEPAAAPCWTTG